MLIQPVDYFLVAWFILAFACTAASTDRSPGAAAWPAACSLRREERTGERDRRPRKAPRPVSGALLSQPSPHRSSERFGSNHLLSPRLTARASVSARTIYSALASPLERAFRLELFTQPSPHRSSERFGSNYLLSPRLTARASVSARTTIATT